MNVHVIKMPDIGEGIAEVEVVAWHVKLGDQVQEDQALADVMTDKAAVEIPSPVKGKVIALGAKAVGLGRFYLFPLAAAGRAGVERALGLLRTEVERGMKLMGCKSISELSREQLRFR